MPEDELYALHDQQQGQINGLLNDVNQQQGQLNSLLANVNQLRSGAQVGFDDVWLSVNKLLNDVTELTATVERITRQCECARPIGPRVARVRQSLKLTKAALKSAKGKHKLGKAKGGKRKG